MTDKFKNDTKQKRSPRWYFYLILVLIPVLFFIMLEVSLRVFNYGKDVPQWVDAGRDKYIINPDIAYKYFNRVKNIPTTIEDVFDKVKKKNAFRVFVLGESSAAGYPYMPMGSFSRYVRKRLELAYPETPVEVVNISLTAINSYTIRDLIPGVLEQRPDLILIYTGHNEYYGALGVGSMESLGTSRSFINLILYLNKYKTIQLLKNLISSSIEFVAEKNSEPSGTLMSRMAKDQYIAFNSDKYEDGLDQFKGNMQDVLQMIKEKKVPVILGKLVSNLRDQKPFISVKDGYPAASEVFEKATNALHKNDLRLADSLFRFAKDLDGLRFRASEKLNSIIDELGEEFNVPSVAFDSILAAKSKYGIIGDELMTDHLHPNLEGYELIGKGFYETMTKAGYLPKGLTPAVPFEKQDSLTKLNFVFSDLDSLMGNNKIKLLKNDWPFTDKKHSKPVSDLFKPVNMIDSIALKVINNNLPWLDAHTAAANAYLNRNDINGYLKHMDILLYQYPIIVEYYDQAALVLMQKKDYSRALKYLEARYKMQPSDYSAKWIGNIALFNGDNDKAIEYLNSSYKLNNNDAQVLYNLAGAYVQKKDFRTALSVITNCLKINPSYPGANELRMQLSQAVNSGK